VLRQRVGPALLWPWLLGLTLPRPDLVAAAGWIQRFRRRV